MTGLLILDKPEDFTSFDLVAKCRRMCKEKKCGHSGTLDPMATGVMTLLFGGATGFCELLPDHDKTYEATVKLGVVTDTLDITGKVIEEREVNVTAEDFREAAKSFLGGITQLPPMYSAVSVGGKRLYDLARQGIEVERPSRQVIIRSLDITRCDEAKGEYDITVSCSSGTYIRTLIADIGEKLGCGAVMTALRRTKANGFDISDAITLKKLEEICSEGRLDEYIIPVEKAVDAYPKVSVTEAQAIRFANGGELSLERLHFSGEKGLWRVYGPADKFLGLGEVTDAPDMKVRKGYRG